MTNSLSGGDVSGPPKPLAYLKNPIVGHTYVDTVIIFPMATWMKLLIVSLQLSSVHSRIQMGMEKLGCVPVGCSEACTCEQWAWGKGDLGLGDKGLSQGVCVCVCVCIPLIGTAHITFFKHNVIRLVGANTPTEQGNIMILCHEKLQMEKRLRASQC